MFILLNTVHYSIYKHLIYLLITIISIVFHIGIYDNYNAAWYSLKFVTLYFCVLYEFQLSLLFYIKRPIFFLFVFIHESSIFTVHFIICVTIEKRLFKRLSYTCFSY